MAEARYTDLDMSLTMLPTTKDLVKLRDEQAVKNALKNLLLTELGEFPFTPEVDIARS